MGFPDSILTTDEQVVLHLHPHWKRLIGPVWWLFLVVLAVVAAGMLWGAAGLLVMGLLGLGLVSWLTLWPWLDRRSTHYVFTNERVLLREGVLTRHGRDIPLGRINDVSFSHSIFERMIGSGTMTIESAGERGQLTLSDLPRVEHAQSVLYELVEADRQRHTFGDEDREALLADGGSDRPRLPLRGDLPPSGRPLLRRRRPAEEPAAEAGP